MKLLLVEWVDSNASYGWQGKEKETHASACVTVGVLTREDKDEVEMTLNISEGSLSEVIAIPRCSIKRIRELKVIKGG